MIRVVIPTHGRPDILSRTLDSLGECRLPEGFLCVTVVENGGRNGAEQIAAEAADRLNVSYLYHEQGNKSAALNRVLQDTGDELLIFLDDDVRLDPETLCAYSDAVGQSTRPAFFGGPIRPDYEVTPEPWVNLPTSARGWSLPAGSREVTQPIFLGCNWVVWARDLREAGGFNPQVGPGGTSGGRGQESEMQLRLLDRGLVGVYVEPALVWHYVPADRCSVKWSLERARQHGISAGLMAGRRGLLLGTGKSAVIRSVECLRAFWRVAPPLGYSVRLEYEWWRGYATGCSAVIGRKKAITAVPEPEGASLVGRLTVPQSTTSSNGADYESTSGRAA